MNKYLNFLMMSFLLVVMPAINIWNLLVFPSEEQLEILEVPTMQFQCLKKNNFYRLKMSAEKTEFTLKYDRDCSKLDGISADVLLGFFDNDVWMVQSNRFSVTYEKTLEVHKSDALFGVFFFWTVGGGMYFLMKYSQKRKMKSI